LVLLNTHLGTDSFNQIRDKCQVVDISLDAANLSNPFLSKSANENPKRHLFFNRYENESLHKLIPSLTRVSYSHKYIKIIIKKIIKLINPKILLKAE